LSPQATTRPPVAVTLSADALHELLGSTDASETNIPKTTSARRPPVVRFDASLTFFLNRLGRTHGRAQ
jgi:hypothetical protein